MGSDERPRVLCVDDEPHVLEGLARLLRRRYAVTTAAGAAAGLAVLGRDGPFAVVVSDLRMPSMDGVSFLAQARALAPDTVRLLLTGYADLDAAIAAVNQGQIYRFLTKPCTPEVLFGALDAATEQYRLIAAERALLEQTLSGSIEVLADLLRRVKTERRLTAAERPTPGEDVRRGLPQDLSPEPPPEPAGRSRGYRPASRPGQPAGPARPASPATDQLTPREREVLRLLTQGLTNREIAHRLVVSPGTIKVHVEHIIAKLGVADRTQAAVRAIELDLMSRSEWHSTLAGAGGRREEDTPGDISPDTPPARWQRATAGLDSA